MFNVFLANRVFIVSHAVVYQSSAKACQEFQQHFNHAPPARTTVQYWKQKFEKTGKLSTKPRSGRLSDEIMKEKVVNFVKENDCSNQRETARVCMTSQSSTQSTNINRVVVCKCYSSLRKQCNLGLEQDGEHFEQLL